MMGSYLDLLPMAGTRPMMGSSNWSHEIIRVPRDFDVFDKIRKIDQMAVDPGFSSYLGPRTDDGEGEGEHSFGDTTIDPLGNPVKFCKAGDLKKCGIEGPAGAYVDALEDTAKVALYWS